MRYWVLCICLTIAPVLLLSSPEATDKPKTAPAPPADVLILHDSVPMRPPSPLDPNPPGVIDSNNILDLLGHFGLKGAVRTIEEYKANDINRYRFAFILGVDRQNPPYNPALIANVRSASIPVFWIGKHLTYLTSDPQFTSRIGFHVSGPGISQGFTTVQYKGTTLQKGDPSISPVQILDPAKTQVLATAHSTGGMTLPYIARSGNFWYCADSPFSYAEEGDRYLAFCDLLHDFFNIQHQEESNALVRLEDITPDDDPDVLMTFADCLHDRKIPFQIGLVPIFHDGQQPDVYLSDRPAFVRAIRYMISKGGSVVMHGVTHQYRGKSTDDYEFWDDFSDRPISGDSRALLEEKLRRGLDECFKNGIYPLTWETPHYAASQQDYRTVAEYFNSSYERILSLDRGESGHYFPYTTTDRFGRFIIPENLGYIPEEKPDPSILIKNGERLKVVRDGVASFFFHPFLDIKYLKNCIDGIEGLGYRFISIRDFDLKVQMDSRLIQTYTESVRLPLKNTYLHRFLLDEKGRRSGESYSQKPQRGIIRDPGIVPPETILVMEGVPEVTTQHEPEEPSALSKIWSKIQARFGKESGKEPVNAYIPTQPQVLVLWDDSFVRENKNDQESYRSAFADFGFRISTVKWKDYSKASISSADTILVVPYAVAKQLSEKQSQGISEFVRDGGNLVLDGGNTVRDGPCRLGELLGIRTEKRSVRVEEVKDGTQKLSWDPPVNVVRYSVRNPIAVYAQDTDSELPMSTLIQYGKGRLLYLATQLDPDSPLGYTRFPYFIHHVLKGFGLRLPFQQSQLELYFDPGGRNRDVDIERLAIDWRKLGVRAIYAAAFQFWPSWSYDYGRLIDICHKNGILVYAWFELPHVSPKFWDDHPNWRAKTATGADANGEDGKKGWRSHMDLDIPECQDAAYDFVEDLLKQYPWDGVNIAELNYDTVNGPEDPKNYIPMGPTTRSAFKALGGFDPILLFSPDSPYYWKENPNALRKFSDYRSQRVLAWHRALLERLTPIAQEKDMEMIVTAFDSLHSSTVTRDTGVVSQLILSLMDQFPFTLQVEDPAHFWAKSPNRYQQFADAYLKLVRDPKRLMFDINVVDRDIRHSDAPSQLAVGIELARTLLSAAEASGRVGIYSEGTIPIEDLQTLANVLAHNARLENRGNTWVAQTGKPVLMAAPGDWQHFKMDNIFWPGWSQNDVFIPKGTHRIAPAEKKWAWLDIPLLKKFKLFDTSVLDIRLVHYAGNLERLARTDRGIQFSYNSNMRSVALFNKQPFKILMDGKVFPDPVVSHSGLWSVRMPRGRHDVDVLADSTALVFLEKTSVYSSALIFVFGAVACSLMLLIYFSILARRAVGRAAKSGNAPTASPHSP
jgi:uncharacterized protein YdaL